MQVIHWFLPEQPGRLTGIHILKTGNGALFADKWPAPEAILAETAGSYVLLGNPEALAQEDLRLRIRGSVSAGDEFVPLLKANFPNLRIVEKAVYVLQKAPSLQVSNMDHVRICQLHCDDTHHLWGLSPSSSWITRTWSGPVGLADSSQAFGVFINDQLASVSCTYYVGQTYQDVAVTTERNFQGKGLCTACAAALCREILTKGFLPIWNTALDNPASIRVAEKLGFELVKKYPLYYC